VLSVLFFFLVFSVFSRDSLGLVESLATDLDVVDSLMDYVWRCSLSLSKFLDALPWPISAARSSSSFAF